MLVGHSPKLCTNNYHWGWPIQNQTTILTKSFTAMSAPHLYPVVLAGLYSDRHQNQCSKTVHVGRMLQTALKMPALVCDMGYTLIKNVAQYIYIYTHTQDLLAEHKVGLKHVILMSFHVGEKIWLYKNPKFWNIQLFPIAAPLSCFISSQTCYKHTWSIQCMSTLDATLLLVITYYCVLFICNQTRTPNITLVTYKFLITGLFASETWLEVGPMNFLIKCRCSLMILKTELTLLYKIQIII